MQHGTHEVAAAQPADAGQLRKRLVDRQPVDQAARFDHQLTEVLTVTGLVRAIHSRDAFVIPQVRATGLLSDDQG